ncbi:MAG TPA: protein-glutamate O-methyltransferase CheR [Geobacteraceae bacterium]
MTDPFFERIREFVLQRSRLSFTGHKKAILRQRLGTRLEQLGLADYAAYWDHLQRTETEEAALYDLLTTNETFFFRNPEQFRYLREAVLPALELRRGESVVRSWGSEQQGTAKDIMKLRILCAGCSTGEEPYSVAMTLLEALRYPRAWDIEILAGDLSESCLRTARAGFYETERLKGILASLRKKYLVPVPGGAVVRDDLKQLIRFTSLNLNNLMNGELPPGFGPGFSGFDIIFCRNVMIYFSPSCQQQLVDTLYRLLSPRGYLLTGDAEPLHLFAHDFVTVREAGCLIYQKTEKTDDANAEC